MNKTVCLNMIVKNESHVIERCLASVKKIIDYWVIVDTGSSDGTQQIIREFLKDIPGELHERKWVDFAFNRNEALQLAQGKGDYWLFIDADEFLVIEEGFGLPSLSADVYYCPLYTDYDVFYQEMMVASRLDWKWEGVLHEGVVSPQARIGEILQGFSVVARSEGSRSQKQNKYLSDAAILEKEVQKDPTNARNVFYLAVSYGLGGNYSDALIHYEKRAAMGGNPEEIFIALLSIGVVQEILGMDSAIFLKSLEKAYLFRPSRAESLFFIARYWIHQKNFFLGYLVSRFALTIPYPQDSHFVRHSIYEYELLLQWAESSYALGKIQETCEAYRQLIDRFEQFLNQKQYSQVFKDQIRELLPGMKQFLREAV